MLSIRLAPRVMVAAGKLGRAARALFRWLDWEFQCGPEPTGWVIQLTTGMRTVVKERGGIVRRFGWGYDSDLPLRPWPAWHKSREVKPDRTYGDVTITWFGFMLGSTAYVFHERGEPDETVCVGL